MTCEEMDMTKSPGYDIGSQKESKFGCFMSAMELMLLILLLTFVSMFTGCSMTRNVKSIEKSEENLADSSAFGIRSVSAENVLVTDYWKRVMSGRSDARITVYDTSKPSEESTGRPPVIMDIELATSMDVVSTRTDTTIRSSTDDTSLLSEHGSTHDRKTYSYSQEDLESETFDGILMWSLLFGGFAIATAIKLGWWRWITNLFRKD